MIYEGISKTIAKPNYKWSNMAPTPFPRELKKSGLSKGLGFKIVFKEKLLSENSITY